MGTSAIFYLLGWTDGLSKTAVLTIGTVVAVSASIAGDISQDLKSGYIIGATPRRQQASELFGAFTSAFFIALAVVTLGEVYGFGSRDLAAPQATLMKTVVDGVLQANLPWNLVLIGASFAIVSELLSVPSLPFAVGIYLPLSTMTPVFLGGVIKHFVELKKNQKTDDIAEKQTDTGVLLSSGLIAGEGIMGVLNCRLCGLDGLKTWWCFIWIKRYCRRFGIIYHICWSRIFYLSDFDSKESININYELQITIY